MATQIKQCTIIDCVTCDETSTALEVAKLLKGKNVRYAYVLKDNFPVGVVSALDFVTKVVAEEKDTKETLAKDFMTFPIDTIDVNEYVSKAFISMNEKSIFSLPVVESGKLKGMVTFHEIIRIINEENKDKCKQ